MSTIDINTETGEIKMPMRRVEGIEEVRVRAWIELVTIANEWVTNTVSGINYQAIYDGADDELIGDDVAARLTAQVPNVASVSVAITRATDDDGFHTIEVVASVTAFDQVITVSMGTTL